MVSVSGSARGIQVVHILTHSALRRDAATYNITEGWHAKLGRALARHTPYDDIACWTVDFEADQPRRYEEAGIGYQVFPSRLLPGTRNRFVRPYFGSAKPGVEFSWPLVSAARRIAASGPSAIHLHSDTYLNTYVLARFLRDIPVFLQHHGGLSGATRIERRVFRDLAHAFVLTPEKRTYLVDDVGLPPDRVSIRTMGVDTNQFSPRDRSPRDLGYDVDNLLLFVGKYSEYKGLDRVLEAFETLRSRWNIGLVLLGGTANDPLFDRARSTEGVVPITEYLPTENVIDHYAAADVFVSFPVERSLRSGDCGIISPVEALACGTPVVSPVLRFFPESVGSGTGHLPTDTDELVEGVEAALAEPPDEASCTAAARDHFSWERVAADVAAIYDDWL